MFHCSDFHVSFFSSSVLTCFLLLVGKPFFRKSVKFRDSLATDFTWFSLNHYWENGSALTPKPLSYLENTPTCRIDRQRWGFAHKFNNWDAQWININFLTFLEDVSSCSNSPKKLRRISRFTILTTVLIKHKGYAHLLVRNQVCKYHVKV